MSRETLLFFLNIGKGLALSALPPFIAQAVRRVEDEIKMEAKRRRMTTAQLLSEIGVNLDALDAETDATIAKAEKAMK
jgi:hypothetical protein